MAFVLVERSEFGGSYVPEHRVLELTYSRNVRETDVIYLDPDDVVTSGTYAGEPVFIGPDR